MFKLNKVGFKFDYFGEKVGIIELEDIRYEIEYLILVIIFYVLSVNFFVLLGYF